MILAKPRILGQLADGTDVVEIYCPVCGCDRVERLEDDVTFKCCRCGVEFQQDYGDEL